MRLVRTTAQEALGCARRAGSRFVNQQCGAVNLKGTRAAKGTVIIHGADMRGKGEVAQRAPRQRTEAVKKL